MKAAIKSMTAHPEVEYNVFKALHVIENDSVLNNIFRDGDTKLSYNMLRSLIKQGTLSAERSEVINEMFNKLIVKNSKLLKVYLAVEDEVEVSNKLPKHYGKKRILADIEANETKTELDRAMLAINDLRNVYSALKRRAIKDKMTGSKTLNVTVCREIIATVRMVQNKVSHIIN